MLTYLLRRLALALSVILATLVSTFMLFFAGPADPAQAMCPETRCTPERLAQITRSIGLDKPLVGQFTEYFKGLFVGRDFVYAGDTVHCGAPCLGFSFVTRQSVNEELFTRFPNTVVLALMAAVIFVTVGVTSGIFAATRRGTPTDRVVVGSSQVIGAIPYYVLALLVALYPVVLWGLLPQYTSIDSGVGPYLAGMIAPALILGLVTSVPVHPLHPQLDDRDTVDGLHPNGSVQGHLRAHGAVQARLPGRDEPHRDDPGPRHGRPADRHAHHRADLRCRRHRQTRRSRRSGLTTFPSSWVACSSEPSVVVMMNLLVDIAYSFIDPRVRLS